ncbi:hypothetical protein AMEX_G8354 [Astyanax mexicanus]|uniref:Uncharacterized protein n=1 Tax=Astyanax mexicanus TaxID=7994 RepID=A0A8T2LUY8_ASTMX|nr:hypothetical protein AMEX_G8354 [Astyanax mexicanus]
MEFNRIVGKNLKQEFYDSIDRHSLCLIEIFQSKRGNIGQLLAQLSQQTKDSDDSFLHLDIALLFPPPHLSPAYLMIVIEGKVLMDNI